MAVATSPKPGVAPTVPAPAAPSTTSPSPGSGPDLNAILGQLQGLGSQLPPGSPLAGLWPSLVNGILAPAIQGEQAQANIITGPGGQQDLTLQQLALQGSQASQEAGFAQQALGFQAADLGIERNLLTQQYGPDPSKALGGFSGQQQALTAAEQQLQNQQARRALLGGAAASGATETSGARQNWSDLMAQYGFQQKQLALSGKEQQAQAVAAEQRLNNTGAQLGLSGQEIKARLSNSLASLGLQGQMDANSFLAAVDQLQQGVISGPFAQVIADVLQGAGIPWQAVVQPGLPTQAKPIPIS